MDFGLVVWVFVCGRLWGMDGSDLTSMVYVLRCVVV